MVSSLREVTYQAGYLFRFYLLDTGNGPAGAGWGPKRVMTKHAVSTGSDYIVGRPITQAEDPVAAYHANQG